MDNGEKKQKILMVHNYYQIPGGEDTVVANEKKLLEDHGHEVILYTRNNSEIETMSIFRKCLLPFSFIYNPRTSREIKRIIKEEKIDIVHVHNTLALISPSVYYAARKCKVPVVQTIHNFRFICPGALLYRDGHICEDCLEKGLRCAIKHSCYRNSRFQTMLCVLSMKIHRMTGIYKYISFICLTEFNKKKLLSLKAIDKKKVYVKPNFVFQSKRHETQTDVKNQFIFVGRLDEFKGIEIILEAWKELGKDSPQLIICGSGPKEGWCRNYIIENNINARLLGRIPTEEVKEILADSKALIYPTKWYEGMPMGIIEAFSEGTPAISGDFGNMSELIDDRNNGLKYASNNPNELIDIVLEFEKTNRQLLSSNACKKYKEIFSPESNYKRLITIYNSIMPGGK